MKSWKKQNKRKFLKTWCINPKVRNDTLKMFDLHCDNKKPWTWDYQWVYSCWANKGYGIIPKRNLVKNIGIGNDASNMHFEVKNDEYPGKIEELEFPLAHTQVKIDKILDGKYYLQTNFFQKVSRKVRSFF